MHKSSEEVGCFWLKEQFFNLATQHNPLGNLKPFPRTRYTQTNLGQNQLRSSWRNDWERQRKRNLCSG